MWTFLLAFIPRAIVQGIPLLYGSTGEIITEKSGNLNLGIPGVMYVGGICGVIGSFFYERSAGGAANMNGFLAIAIPMLCCLLGSLLMGLLYCFLTVTLRANQNVTGLALTTFGVGVGNFFGGSLNGITAKLDDLAALGVTVLYLNPIFESASNHRYNTADYLCIDPMLGTEEDFRRLCREAKQRGIRVILDGVFNHTGSQSRYFNADGFYPSVGAAQSTDSPYFNWFSFHPWPTDYDAWWGIMTLPAVQENEPDYRDFIIRGQDSVVRHWLRAGASGWRLDVADELPDDFIAEIRTAMEETAPDSFLLGEVWEDATTKVAYSQRRRYLLGHELHGVMNYPFRTALIAYLRGGDADDFRETLETLRENYPPEAFLSLMNFLGTHDTPRILTVLGADNVPDSKADRAAYRLSPAQRQIGLERLRLAALILFTFPGAPTVYYGDEAAMEGWEDPFNRAGYPWEQEDTDLKAHFAELARFRRSFPALQAGVLHWIWTSGPLLIFARELDGQLLTTVVNAADVSQALSLPWSAPPARDLLTGQRFIPTDNAIPLTLPPRSGWLLQTDLP